MSDNEQLDDEVKRNNSATILCTKKEPLNGLHKVVYGKQLWKLVVCKGA
jgi:hypothetical protein